HGLGAGLLAEPRVLLEVAVGEAVCGAVEPMRPEGALQPPRPPPRPVEHPQGPRQKQQPGHAPSQAPQHVRR
ncbi:unnamed protein product, partial [Musa acuminata subsp. malaccensis]